MNRSIALAMLVLCLVPGVSEAAAGPVDLSANDLYRRMLGLNADMRSYKATVHVDVALKTFPYLSPSLDGNAYYEQPDRQAIVFDTVPALASQFKKVYPNVDPPGRWPGLYDATVLGDQGGITTFRLTPKRTGRIAHLDVKVDDGTATTRGYTWTYNDGGYVSFDQTVKNVGRDYLVDRQSGHVDFPSYKADVVSNFSNYQLNVAIPHDVFAEK